MRYYLRADYDLSITTVVVIFCFVTGCDESQINTLATTQPISPAVAPFIQNPQPKEKPVFDIDLTLTPAMIEEAFNEITFDDLPEEVHTQLLNTVNPEKTVLFSGRLHLDNNREKYMERLEGAEVTTEFKFE